MDDASLQRLLSVVLAGLFAGYALVVLIGIFRRSRPDLDVLRPVLAGLAVRWFAIAGVSATGLATTLRGGDELGFLRSAREVAATPFLSASWDPSDALHRLHTLVFALQLKLFDASPLALRVTQTGLAMVGILLVVVAVYDLAGGRAAQICAWFLALEPSSVFFSGILHKEPLLMLATGLVVFGGAKVWRHLHGGGVAAMAAGVLVAVGTRPYVGWFLAAGALALLLHASLRQIGGRLRSLGLLYACVVALFLAAPAVLQATSSENLQKQLQTSQNANTDPNLFSNKGLASNANNLSLERVDYSSRGALVTNLPRRIRDILLRPYPWQVATTSQALGLLGTLVALTCLGLLLRGVLSEPRALRDLAPLGYVALFLLIAYALSVGNAGTGFRYRTHLVMLVLAMVAAFVARRARAGAPKSADAGGAASLRGSPGTVRGSEAFPPVRHQRHRSFPAELGP